LRALLARVVATVRAVCRDDVRNSQIRAVEDVISVTFSGLGAQAACGRRAAALQAQPTRLKEIRDRAILLFAFASAIM